MPGENIQTILSIALLVMGALFSIAVQRLTKIFTSKEEFANHRDATKESLERIDQKLANLDLDIRRSFGTVNTDITNLRILVATIKTKRYRPDSESDDRDD